MSRTAKIALVILAALIVSALGLATVMYSLQGKINQRLQKGWVLPPLEIYSQGVPLRVERRLPLAALEQEFQARDWQPGRDFERGPIATCAAATGIQFQDVSEQCLWLKSEKLVITWDQNNWVRELWQGEPMTARTSVAVFPRLITQFFDGKPILQVNTPLSEMPLYCLQAVTAIEDRDFLIHKGVSTTGILRAVIRNLKAGRWAEGGSTITQQLVKNFFLNSKKTLRRKINEQLLAIMLESQISKDQILEMYLNVIYMGQNGPYQVLGFGSAAGHYFDKTIAKLSLPECALLGAVINSPGRFSPFEHPDSARTRRELVLSKMRDEGMISGEEFMQANQTGLPKVGTQTRVHAPYFVMSALKEFQNLEIAAEEGARLYTTLDAEAQALMLSAIGPTIRNVEAKVKKPPTQPLQVAAITIDLSDGKVLALTGGRDFRSTQYNRASDSRRQIGSVVKPFVYWPALVEHDPLTAVVDEPFEWKVGRNVWKPKNYDGKIHGPVPYFYALAQSLNIPAAKIGQEVSLETIAETIEDSGIRMEVPRLPSLTLGAFELPVWEVAQGFTTVARFGRSTYIHTLRRVEDIDGEVLFEHPDTSQEGLAPVPTALLVGMMRQSLNIGTARAARAWGLKGDYAGKTGTTSDTKDAWFVGFDSHLLTVVWVGYDDNTAMGLTGASAALPVWTEISKAYEPLFEPRGFAWPEGIEVRSVSRAELESKFSQISEWPESLELAFTNWAF